MSLQARWQASAPGQWYLAQGQRDQMAVLGLTGFLALVLFWLLLVAPIRSWRAEAEQRWHNNADLVQQISDNAQQLRQQAGNRPGASAVDAGQLMTLVANSSRSFGLTLARFQPESGGGVSVVLQAQEFNALARWLDQLASRQRVTIVQMTIDAGDVPGRVDARVVLRP